ncbi:shikimate dehydrogenase [Carboxylicivirga mesophila]|uniref:Shikimate dehydrogenase n=1 Tax=Carboxylicivirga mesophila TaxID=1166478 RepID=A0ABS5KBX3_9BACT|nr:shikimate dehydrogenase [Carboxylicivirga mesophila]MBS2212441.1 shikimate dehydrogenase [Carboxylicivirga mesophila]
MRTFGLIGFPLAQSFSQKYFTQKFENENIDARYLNFEIENIDELPALLNQHPYIAGFSVTIPHKEKVLKYLDEMDETAQKAGACNAIKVTWENKIPKLTGYNTDLIGFSESIKPLLQKHHQKALILGTGGAAKAIAHAFRLMDIDYKYVSRTKGSDSLCYSDITSEIMKDYTVLVNCTPLGMFPNINTCPDIPYNLVTDKHLLYDLTYNPPTTLFMQKGIEQGATTKNGLDMLHLQAEAAWKIWNS